MKMLIAIVQDWAEEAIVQMLTAEEYRVTKLTSSGGFLRQGSTTLLIGVEAADLDNCLKKIEGTCQHLEPRRETEQRKVSNVTLFVLDELPLYSNEVHA